MVDLTYSQARAIDRDETLRHYKLENLRWCLDLDEQGILVDPLVDYLASAVNVTLNIVTRVATSDFRG
jgi:hypothetical protein